MANANEFLGEGVQKGDVKLHFEEASRYFAHLQEIKKLVRAAGGTIGWKYGRNVKELTMCMSSTLSI
eukprot:1158878-Pelagomonas_calceolata.AAC.3